MFRHADSVRELEDSVATLNTEQLRRLARLGAIARLEQLKQEEAAIRAEFPELFGRGRRLAGERCRRRRGKPCPSGCGSIGPSAERGKGSS